MKRSLKLTAALTVLLVSSSYGQSHRTPTLSDNDIELEVQQALSDPAFNGSSIQSAVSAGVVKLYGNTRNNDEKTLAEAKITNLRGVKSINDLLNVIDRTTASVTSSTPVPVAPKTVTVPQGTTIPIRLTGEIDTKTATAGDTFNGTTAANVSNAGAVVIPTGTPVSGRIVEAKSAGRLSGAAVLSIELVSLKLPAPSGQPQDVSIVTKPLSNKNQGNGTVYPFIHMTVAVESWGMRETPAASASSKERREGLETALSFSMLCTAPAFPRLCSRAN